MARTHGGWRRVVHIVAAAIVASIAPASFAQQGSAEDAAREIVADSTMVVGSAEYFRLTADLFSRSYFSELVEGARWTPDDPRWQRHYPVFFDDVLRIALPDRTDLDTYLAFHIARHMSAPDLAELKARNGDPRVRDAVERLRSVGLDLRFVLLAQSAPEASSLYSSAERQSARRTADILRRQVPEIERMQPDLKLLADLMRSPAFLHYQNVLGGAFIHSVGRLERDPARRKDFDALLGRWKARLAEQK